LRAAYTFLINGRVTHMRHRYSIHLVGAMLVLASLARAADQAAKPPQPASTIAFVHSNVIPMDRERVLEDQTVVVVGDRIRRIGPASAVKVDAKARRIDATGKYLIPGMVDAHVHLQSQTEFALYLAKGVTTVFNLDGRPAHLRWRKQVADGEVLGPTIFTTGPIFHQKRTAEEDVRLVDEQAVAGYDAVKIYNEVSKEEYPALIAEAKRNNLLLMGHVARGPGFATTLQSGQSIAHLEEIVYTNFNPKNDDDFDHIVFDESKIPATARQVKDAGVFVTATLNNFSLIVEQATDLATFLKNPELQYVSPWTLENFQPDNDRYKNRFEPRQYPILRNLLAIQRKLLKALSDEGVPLMAGTDATEVGPVAGFGLPHELEEFVQDGLTPYQALATATTNPARYFRQGGEFGTIEAGKRADVVLLDGNPLREISQTEKVAGVMVRGRWLDGAELKARLQAVPAAYQAEQQKVETMLRTDPAGAETYLAEHDPLGRLGAFAISNAAAKESPAELVAMLEALRKANPSADLVSEESVNGLGYALMNKKMHAHSVAVLAMNTQRFPKSANTWDSLADAFAHAGDVPSAVKNYQKALEVDAGYAGSDFAKKFLVAHGQK
jgi:imidazolonepropionase-like amidohydrolase